MSEKKLTSTTPFAGEAIIRFRVYPKVMDNILFTLMVLEADDIPWFGGATACGPETWNVWEQVSQGKTIAITDKKTGVATTLDSEKMMQGIRLWIENGEGHCDGWDIHFKFEKTAADHIVQYALFGEVKYE